MTGWENWLAFYYEKYKRNFLVQKLTEFPYPWLNYNTDEYKTFIIEEKYVSQREVFYDEIVFDIDMDKELSPQQSRLKAEELGKILSDRLKVLNYSHKVWSSGGTGVHIHLFFPELLKLHQIDNRIIRKQFLIAVGEGFIRPREASGRVQLQFNTLIQLEEAPHRKGGKKKLLWEYKTKADNVLLPAFYDKMDQEKVRNDLMSRYFKEKNNGKKPEAIVFLENEKFIAYKDGRDRACFILAGYYKQFLTTEEVFQKLIEWNNKQLGSYFPEKVLKAKAKSAKPGVYMNYIITLFDELGIDEKYLEDLREKKTKS